MCIVLFSKLYCSADIGAEVQRVSVSETAIIFCYAHPSKHGRATSTDQKVPGFSQQFNILLLKRCCLFDSA